MVSWQGKRQGSRVFVFTSRWIAIGLASICTFVLLGWLAFPAQSGTLITVNTTVDEFNTDGDCSLREAIYSANDDSSYDNCPVGDGADIIVIPAGTYTITIEGLDNNGDEGDFDILSDMTLQGAGAGTTILTSSLIGQQNVLHIPSDTYALSVTIKDLSINGNNSDGYPGGLNLQDYNSTVSLEDCSFENNQASSNAGAIWNDGTLTVRRCTFDSNSAGTNGGAIYSPGSLYIYDSTFMDNKAILYFGGAIGMGGGVLHIENSTFTGNEAGTNGGAIFFSSMTGSLSSVTINDNTADADDSGPNDVGDGGGVYIHSGTLTVRNSIIAGNIDNSTAGTPVVHPDCSGSVTSGGYNLLGENDGCSGLTDGTNGDQVGPSGSPIDPLLDPLADNGGPTQTLALPFNSPAVEAGNPTGCRDQDGALLDTDQRGYIRPWGSVCDIGAYEYNSPGIPNEPSALLLNLYRSPASILKGSAASGPNQWFARVALGDHTGDPGLAFHYVVWLHVPEDWTLPWATQYSFTGDFASTALSADWSAQSWVQDANNCSLGGAADAGFKWRAFRGPQETLTALVDRLDNQVNLRGGLGVPSGETSDVYGGVRVIVGSYYDFDPDGTPDRYTCDHVAVTNIVVP